MSDPPVLLLDEPTSGTDSFTAYVIAKHCKKLAAEEGKTVLITIHQPSTEIY